MPGVRRQVDQRAARVALDDYLFVAGEQRDRSGVRSRAMSTSPRSSSRRWASGSARGAGRRGGRPARRGGNGDWLPGPPLVGLPAQQPERPGARRCWSCSHAAAEIAVLLMGKRQLPVHYRSDAGRERVQHQARESTLRGWCMRTWCSVDHLDQVADAVRVPAELAEDEGRRSVAAYRALQGELDVPRPYRVAGVEGKAVADPQGDGSCRRRSRRGSPLRPRSGWREPRARTS